MTRDGNLTGVHVTWSREHRRLCALLLIADPCEGRTCDSYGVDCVPRSASGQPAGRTCARGSGLRHRTNRSSHRRPCGPHRRASQHDEGARLASQRPARRPPGKKHNNTNGSPEGITLTDHGVTTSDQQTSGRNASSLRSVWPQGREGSNPFLRTSLRSSSGREGCPP